MRLVRLSGAAGAGLSLATHQVFAKFSGGLGLALGLPGGLRPAGSIASAFAPCEGIIVIYVVIFGHGCP